MWPIKKCFKNMYCTYMFAQNSEAMKGHPVGRRAPFPYFWSPVSGVSTRRRSRHLCTHMWAWVHVSVGSTPALMWACPPCSLPAGAALCMHTAGVAWLAKAPASHYGDTQRPRCCQSVSHALSLHLSFVTCATLLLDQHLGVCVLLI